MGVFKRLIASLMMFLIILGSCHNLVCGQHKSCCGNTTPGSKHVCCHAEHHNHDHDEDSNDESVLHCHAAMHECWIFDSEWIPLTKSSNFNLIAAYILIYNQLRVDLAEQESHNKVWLCEVIPDSDPPSTRLLRAPPAFV